MKFQKAHIWGLLEKKMTAWGTAVFKNLLSSNEAENLHESISYLNGQRKCDSGSKANTRHMLSIEKKNILTRY